MSEFSFGEPQATTRDNLHWERDILEDGRRVGTMDYIVRDDEVEVKWITAFGGRLREGPGANNMYRGANLLGTRAMRQLGRQLISEGFTHVSGNRVSGIRRQNRAKGFGPRVVIELRAGKVLSSGNDGDQPRDDHGRWTRE